MFGRKLKELRLENNINQAELGKIIGISPSTVGMYERNQRFPDKDILNKIADYFEVSIDYLFDRTNFKNGNIEHINPNPNESLFANRLRQERERLGLMQKELAQKLDIPPNTYNGYETGKRSPNLEITKHISDILKISVDYLLGRTDFKELNKERVILEPNMKTIASPRLDNVEDLDDDAIEKINEYIEFIRMQQNKNK